MHLIIDFKDFFYQRMNMNLTLSYNNTKFCILYLYSWVIEEQNYTEMAV